MQENELSEMGQLALGWLRSGKPVFPCRNQSETAQDPETGEFKPYDEKSPIISSGLNGATRQERVATKWWTRFPDALVGVPTGAAAGFWILDVDVPSDSHKDDGRDWIDEMCEVHGPLPRTKVARTANGGYHFFFNHVEGVRNRSGKGKEGELGRGVDVRGDGGYIIAPGSVMADGRLYDWEDNDADIADAPQWLLDLVLGKNYDLKTPSPNVNVTNDRKRTYGLKVLEDEAAELASETEGGRGAALNRAAFSCGGLIETYGITEEEIADALYRACVSNGLTQKDGERRVMRDINRIVLAGKSRPRNMADLGSGQREKEAISKRVTVAGLNKIAQKAKELAQRPEWDRNEKDSYENADDGEEEEQKLFITKWDYIPNAEDIPNREVVMAPHFVRRYLSLTVSAGGIGKTTHSVVEALSMCTGKDLLGQKPKGKNKVWLINLEDPRDEMDRKVWAAIKFYGLNYEEVAQRLFVDSGREQDIRIALRTNKSSAVVDKELVGLLVEHIKRNEIDAVIIDPFVSSHLVDENDNGAIDVVAKTWNAVADATDCAIELVHHMKKVEAGTRATSNDARGAVSLASAARSIRVFNRMSEAEAKEWEIPEQYRKSHFVISYEKTSLRANTDGDIWRKIESQGLGNKSGKGLVKDQDSIGVATEWIPPEEKSLSELISNKERAEILNSLRNQQWLESSRSTSQWAGIEVARIIDVDLSRDSRLVKKILDKMIREGLIEAVKEYNPNSRKDQMTLKPKGE